MKHWAFLTVLLVVLAVIPAPATLAQEDRQPITVENAVGVDEVTIIENHNEGIYNLAFSRDSILLAFGNEDTTVRLWNVVTGEEETTLGGHTGPVRIISFSPDGRLLASLTDFVVGDGTIRIWNTETGDESVVLEYGSGTVAFSPDGQIVALDVCSGQVSFSNSGIFCTEDRIRLIDVETGSETLTFQEYIEGRIWSLAFSPDGTLLASGGADGTLRLWEVSTGAEQAILQSLESQIFGVAFNPEGTLLASARGDGVVSLLDVETGEELVVLEGHTEPAVGVAFSPDGTLLASTSVDKTVRLWNVATGSELNILEGHTGAVFSLAFSPDGTLLASGGDDNTVRLWGVNPLTFADAPTPTAISTESLIGIEICSEVGDTDVTVTFINNTSQTVELLWIGYDCQEVSYGMLPPGTMVAQPTYVSHPWRVRNVATGAILAETVPDSSEPYTVSIEE
jgi:WD40 repeat protein